MPLTATGPRRSSSHLACALALAALAFALPAQIACPVTWTPGASDVPGVTGGAVFCLAVHDDGNGPRLYLGGEFTVAGGVVVPHLASWDGSIFRALPSLSWQAVTALISHDDGSGPALYAAGIVSSASGSNPATGSVARFDGTSWTTLTPLMTGWINAFAVFDPGSGAKLYAGGNFTTIGGAAANRIASWNGAAWTPAATSVAISGTTSTDGIEHLIVHDEGAGPRLFAAGTFVDVDGTGSLHVARYDGTSWSPLGSGLPARVLGLTSAGGALVASGQFLQPLPSVTGDVMFWWGGAWTLLPATGILPGKLTTFDFGAGPELVAGSFQTMFTGVGTLRFTAGGWMPLGSPILASGVQAFAVYDSGGGPELYLAATFSGSPEITGIGRIQTLLGGWRNLTAHTGLDTSPNALTMFDDGNGAVLVAGGPFQEADGASCNFVATRSQDGWSQVGNPALNGVPLTLGVHDQGAGPRLYAGGPFSSAGGAAADGIAVFDGSTWSQVGLGLFHVRTMLSFDDGGGPKLFTGGDAIYTPQGATINRIAAWDGTTWQGVGSGITATGASSNTVMAFAAHDDGSGMALYVAGRFSAAGGQPALNVARWNGTAWSNVGSGLGAAAFPDRGVNALAVFDDGTGPKLYAGGNFNTPYTSQLARWDGVQWTILPTPGIFQGAINTLAVYDDGTGAPPTLAAGGSFTLTPAGGQPITNLLRWSASGFQELAGGTDLIVRTLAAGVGPEATKLFAGGSFRVVGTIASAYFAELALQVPSVTLAQPPGAGGLMVFDSGLLPGNEYWNIFSLTPCSTAGGGPYLGLCAPSINDLFWQYLLPVGTLPFHFVPTHRTATFGPFAVPAGITADVVCMHVPAFATICPSPVTRYTTQ